MEETTRKRLLWLFFTIAKLRHEIRVTTLWLKQPICFYSVRSREIYTKGPITSPEILLSEPPQTQDSINSIQETPNSQFRLVLSVTPCMPRISSIESVNHSSSPLLFSPTPTSSPVHAPTPDSPQNQPPPPPLSPTNSPTSFNPHDPHALGKDTGYKIMKVLPQQMGATMCVALLALPHLTPQHQKESKLRIFQSIHHSLQFCLVNACVLYMKLYSAH